eukprot:gene1576-21832_t
MTRRMRAVALCGRAVEADIANCFFVMLLWWCGEDTPHLIREYVSDREGWLTRVRECAVFGELFRVRVGETEAQTARRGRALAKSLFLILLFGGGLRVWVSEALAAACSGVAGGGGGCRAGRLCADCSVARDRLIEECPTWVQAFAGAVADATRLALVSPLGQVVSEYVVNELRGQDLLGPDLRCRTCGGICSAAMVCACYRGRVFSYGLGAPEALCSQILQATFLSGQWSVVALVHDAVLVGTWDGSRPELSGAEVAAEASKFLFSTLLGVRADVKVSIISPPEPGWHASGLPVGWTDDVALGGMLPSGWRGPPMSLQVPTADDVLRSDAAREAGPLGRVLPPAARVALWRRQGGTEFVVYRHPPGGGCVVGTVDCPGFAFETWCPVVGASLVWRCLACGCRALVSHPGQDGPDARVGRGEERMRVPCRAGSVMPHYLPDPVPAGAGAFIPHELEAGLAGLLEAPAIRRSCVLRSAADRGREADLLLQGGTLECIS